MHELEGVAVAHRQDVGVVVEDVDHVDIVVQLARLFGVEELPHLEALPRRPADLVGGRRVDREAVAVEVDHKELHGVNGPGDDDAVDEPALRGHRRRAGLDDGLCDQDVHAVGHRRLLDALRDAHVGRQVRGVDLELASDGALDGPAVVEAAAEVHPAVLARQPLLQARVAAVRRQHRRPVDGAEHLRERDHRHVRELVEGDGLLLQRPPDHEESVAVVLVRVAEELVHDPVDDLRDLVHEGHDVVLEHLGRHAEVPDARHADDALDGDALDHRVHAGAVDAVHVVLDDVGAGLPETYGQQGPELDDGLLEDRRLHELGRLLVRAGELLVDFLHHALLLHPGLGAVPLLDLEVLVGHLHGHQRVEADRVDLRHHVLQGVQDEVVRVVRDDQRPRAERDADEDRDDDGEHGLRLHEGPDVEVEGEVQRLELPLVDVQPRRVLPPLVPPQVLRALRGVADAPLRVLLLQQREAQALELSAACGAVRCPRLAELLLHPGRHAAEVVDPERRVRGLDVLHLLLPLLHGGAPHHRRLRLLRQEAAVVGDHADPEHVAVVVPGAEALVAGALAPAPREPVVVVDVLQQRLLVGLDAALRARDHLRVGLVHVVGAQRRGRGELLRGVDPQERDDDHHDQHQEDHPAGGQLGELLAHPGLRLPLRVVHVDFDVVPVVVVAGVGALLLPAPLPRALRLPGLQDGLVQLQDPHEPQDTHDAPGPGTDLRCPGPPHVVQLLVVALDLLADGRVVEEERDGGHQVQPEEKSKQVVVLPQAGEDNLSRENDHADDHQAVKDLIRRLRGGEQPDVVAEKDPNSKEHGDSRENLALDDAPGNQPVGRYRRSRPGRARLFVLRVRAVGRHRRDPGP
mmetsp:Transcript_72588/g.205224  ORF Transcript_72588/g.205224 Transcript_72588/m.205224 type:complete len:860 (+) Transcript_72588:411-2990(+)